MNQPLEIPFLCPNCHSNRVAPAQGLFDWLFRLFGRQPYSCRLCNARFYFHDARPITHHIG